MQLRSGRLWLRRGGEEGEEEEEVVVVVEQEWQMEGNTKRIEARWRYDSATAHRPARKAFILPRCSLLPAASWVWSA